MYIDEVHDLFKSTDDLEYATEWNVEKKLVVKNLLEKMLYPKFLKQLDRKLRDEAKEGVIEVACDTIREKFLSVGKWENKIPEENNDDGTQSKNGPNSSHVNSSHANSSRANSRANSRKESSTHRSDSGTETESDEEDVVDESKNKSKRYNIMSIVCDDIEGKNCQGYASVLSPDGEVVDTKWLRNYFSAGGPKNARLMEQRKDLDILRSFIKSKKPHGIFIAVSQRRMVDLKKDINAIINDLREDGRIRPKLQVVYTDSDIASIWSQSKQAQDEFPDYQPLLIKAIGVARHVLDPLILIAQLFNNEDSMFCIRLHKDQDKVDKNLLRSRLGEELMIVINEQGVNINQMVMHPHMARALHFICGLGPRKATVRSI